MVIPLNYEELMNNNMISNCPVTIEDDICSEKFIALTLPIKLEWGKVDYMAFLKDFIKLH